MYSIRCENKKEDIKKVNGVNKCVIKKEIKENFCHPN